MVHPETMSLSLLFVSAWPILFYRLALFFGVAKRFGALGEERGKVVYFVGKVVAWAVCGGRIVGALESASFE